MVIKLSKIDLVQEAIPIKIRDKKYNDADFITFAGTKNKIVLK